MILIAAVAGLAFSPAAGQESSASTEPNVVAAWTGDLRSTLDLDGRMIPADASAISLWLERYRDELLILEVVPHGSFVNEGDVLIRFDTRKIDEQIRQVEFDLRQAQEKLANTEEEERIEAEATEAGLTRAGKEAEWAARKLEGYREKERALTVEEIRLRNQSSQHNIEDQRDELEQLEKMYREDELVDATEEIVLKRSRRRLASSIAWANLREQQNEYTLLHTEAIKQEGLELDAAQKSAALDRQHRSAAIKRTTRQASVERARFDFEKQAANLERLKLDLEQLTVRAPRRGLVLHGDVEAVPGTVELERGDRAGLFKKIMAVADPDRLKILTSVPESSLLVAKSGTAAEVTLAAAPDFKAMGRLQVAHLPTGRKGEDDNLYRAEIEMEKHDPRLRPGMRCEVSVIVEEARGAVLIPEAAVTKRADGAVVRCSPRAGGVFAERTVVLGPTDGKNVVIKEGLSAGELVELNDEGGS
ncbi:MAG: efflux RND transporter periplasmic adaptor subunit [Planctomycetota bacterium]|jgi:multidrug efflux pump subunit AcrA (membrane-fusion protein)